MKAENLEGSVQDEKKQNEVVIGGCGRLVVGSDQVMHLCRPKDLCRKRFLQEQGDLDIYPSDRCAAGN